MESFVHLRKGTPPRRLHADLDGLKDDELGRGDVLAGELRPSDATDPAGSPLPLFSNADSGPDRHEPLGQAVGIVTDWLGRHSFAELS